MHAALLTDRAVVRVTGADTIAFLQGLLTADVAALAPESATLAALLTPQGKILVDMLVVRVAEEDGGGVVLDAPRALAADLVRRLGFYKLRAKVAVEDGSTLAVVAVWDGTPPPSPGLPFADPRLPALGHRVVLPAAEAAGYAASVDAAPATEDDYHAHRLALGVPEGGKDFVYGDTFPHEADMDAFGGVSFGKGCYVGQEVVSRMEHRGTARTRIVPVTFDGPAPLPGVEVLAGERAVGRMGSGARGRGLAMLRLDRVADALAAGLPLIAGGVPIDTVAAPWARFTIPTRAAA